MGALIMIRDDIKHAQIAAMKAGVPLRGAQVAIASASHIGSFEQLDAVSSILTAAGLTEDALQCPPDWPEDEEVRTELVRAGRGKSRICMNCSGKHAAFLWACTENDWPTDSYLDPEHPLQRTVLETVEDLGFCAKGQGGPFVADGALRGVALSMPISWDGATETLPTGWDDGIRAGAALLQVYTGYVYGGPALVRGLNALA